MLKKIVLSALFVGLIGVLVAGAIIRTVDKTGQVAEASELDRGHGYGSEGQTQEDCDSEGHGVASVGNSGQGGQGHGAASGNSSGQSSQGQGGNGQGAGSAERQYPNYESAPQDWATYEGTVVQASADGEDLVIETAEGEEITVGTGPGYMEMQGFALQAGELVRVQGYWEDGELKAVQVTRLRDGQTITLRDQSGRPAWAGGGRNAQEGSLPGDGTGTGEAQVEAWVALEGTVVSVDSDALVVRATTGEEITVDGRAWSFAQELGFAAEVGDRVTLLGFYEGEDFEVGQIDDITTSQTVLIREESGRPLWAGRGRRGS